jgi:Ulp1 family protease
MALHWDSLSKTFKKIKERNELVISYLTTWYNQLHTSFGKSPIQFNVIDVDNDDNVPQQDNFNDCGAFAMSFMERIANPTESGIPEYPTIDQSLIPQWRKFVLKSIVRGYIGEF